MTATSLRERLQRPVAARDVVMALVVIAEFVLVFTLALPFGAFQ